MRDEVFGSRLPASGCKLGFLTGFKRFGGHFGLNVRMGSYKWGCKPPNWGYEYSYPTSSPTYNSPFSPFLKLNPKP